MEFIDANEYAAPGHYNCPNEDTRAWREAIKNLVLYRAAGICSGGEIGLFSILPTVRRKLVLVDHSYLSLHVAITKYLILASKGPKETFRLFTTGEHQEVRDACLAVESDLPESVRKCIGQSAKRAGYNGQLSNYGVRNYGDWRKFRQGARYDAYGRYVRDDAKRVPAFDEIQTHWKKFVTLDLVQRAYDKLHLVKFIHGDLRDLAEDGPYGLIYLSNALEHSNRDGQRPKLLDHVKPCLRKGGVLVVAGWYDPYGHTSKATLKLHTRCQNDTSGWGQALYHLTEPVAA